MLYVDLQLIEVDVLLVRYVPVHLALYPIRLKTPAEYHLDSSEVAFPLSILCSPSHHVRDHELNFESPPFDWCGLLSIPIKRTSSECEPIGLAARRFISRKEKRTSISTLANKIRAKTPATAPKKKTQASLEAT